MEVGLGRQVLALRAPQHVLALLVHGEVALLVVLEQVWERGLAVRCAGTFLGTVQREQDIALPERSTGLRCEPVARRPLFADRAFAQAASPPPRAAAAERPCSRRS
ncbi:MAG TPA: hypothetical protein VI006_05325 [Solirubrobacteraceae bacterium]